MSKEQRRLGRGLSSIISIDSQPPPSQPTEPASTLSSRLMVHEVPVELLRANPHQPREAIDSAKLDELAASIRQTGVLQPVLARRRGESYELIAGERRLRAAKLAGLPTVPVLVREAEEPQMLEIALIENLQRDDLNPIERAKAYRQCCTRFGLSVQELASRLGEDRATVANIIRLLELPERIKEMVSTGMLSAGHARSLLGIHDTVRQLELAGKATKEGWSVRQLERVAQAARVNADPSAARPRPPARPQIARLERQLSDSMATRVRILEGRGKNRGRVTIDYYSLDDFDRILRRLGAEATE